MYDRDYDDYEYQQNQMEFAGPDDYYFEWLEESYGPFGDPEREIPLSDYLLYDSYSKDYIAERYIVKTIHRLGNSRQVIAKLKPKYFKFLKNYGINHDFDIDDIKKCDSRLLVVLAVSLIQKFGFDEWQKSINEKQLEYIRANIDKIFPQNSHEKYLVQTTLQKS